MKIIRYNKIDIKMLYQINKTTNIILNTANWQYQSIKLAEVVKQDFIFATRMCCVTKTKVNHVGEKVDHKYGEIEIGMSICMDDISVAGAPEEVKKE